MDEEKPNKKKQLRVLTTTSSAADATNTKTVLPEVLPDPRRALSSSSGNAPRARTLAHMQRLLATAAAVGVASVSCGKETKTPGSESGGCGKKSEANPAPDANITTSEPDAGNMGYAVVDPMPTPAYCRGIDRLIEASATVAEEPNGATHVLVTFPKPKGRDDFKYVNDAPVVGYGGTVVKSEVRKDGAATVTLKVDGGVASNPSKTVSVSVKGTCNQGPTTLSANITWEGAAKTAKPSVYIQQY